MKINIKQFSWTEPIAVGVLIDGDCAHTYWHDETEEEEINEHMLRSYDYRVCDYCKDILFEEEDNEYPED